jgi:hypothetical protein
MACPLRMPVFSSIGMTILNPQWPSWRDNLSDRVERPRKPITGRLDEYFDRSQSISHNSRNVFL